MTSMGALAPGQLEIIKSGGVQGDGKGKEEEWDISENVSYLLRWLDVSMASDILKMQVCVNIQADDKHSTPSVFSFSAA
jgi:hypothetical protein